MPSTPPNRDINTMLENLTITTKEIDIYHTQQKISIYYEDKIFSTIKYIRDRKQRPDVDAIFEHIAKNEASNISEDFIEDSMTKLMKESKVINKKTSEGLDSFIATSKTRNIIRGTKITQVLKYLTKLTLTSPNTNMN